MKCAFLILLVFLFSQCKEQVSPVVTKTLSREGEVVAKIAFGSCNKQNSEQLLWDEVLQDEADMCIWLGDNIYGDSPDREVMQRKYAKQKSNSEYQRIKNTMPVYGIWDDHDYGVNDGGKEFKQKAVMRDLMFDFLEVPLENIAWTRPGGYQAY